MYRNTIFGCVSDKKTEVASNDKLLIYTAFENEQITQYIGAFNKAYPNIQTEVVLDSHGVISSKVLAEKDNPKADVIYGLSIFNMEKLKSENLLAPLDIPNLNDFQANFKDIDNPPYYVGLSGVESAIIINEKELSNKSLPIPQSYKDLTKPIYKGLISMSNPTSSGTGFLTVVGWIELFGEEKAWDYMKELNKNVALYTHSGSKPARMALSGEYPIGISLGYRGHRMLIENKPIKMIFASEGYGFDLESLALLKKSSPNPNAEIFAKWASSDEAMKLYASNNALTGIKQETKPLGYLQDPYTKLAPTDFVQMSEKREVILKQWNTYFDGENKE
ncbi:extracellular solute-binding protein [Helicobacter muridarum]|uniref:2-aminoethylphosphonate ABC transporter substrate-binding protein n=1 Tax=Helicobacter muridarum TaxID=216 RepID=A0A377PTZ1_9HELI|nr:extracellular solute-binding protein [Helicobacter muridarum]TLE01676.1 extracellular solute-binding protein [Helicobacter muridarum]STQ86306.1 2-aminoethylphosphonate ABC transporter substrate-binding protein [Helicobacter muridarum]